MLDSKPVLYSFRRCPYAIRARLAIKQSGTSVELREVVLKQKPEQMLEASPKGSVPILVINNHTIAPTVIDESLDIMQWALARSDPDGWLPGQPDAEIFSLIEENDNDFKPRLDRYKYFERYPEEAQETYLEDAKPYLQKLDNRLAANRFLMTDQRTIADVAIFPFIRQFAMVDQSVLPSLKLPHLLAWLTSWLEDPLFLSCMEKYPRWQYGAEPVYFE